MNNQWSLETHGDPLGKIRDLIKDVWLQAGLSGLLATVEQSGGSHMQPHYLTDPASIDEINPFKPLMELNNARLIPNLLATHPGEKIGALLRPCELRALIEMTKHTALNLSQLLTISVDCLGTLPADEYQWRLERMENEPSAKGVSSDEGDDRLAREALKFAHRGGIIPYRYRSACQVCPSPAAAQADINIHVLGLPVRQRLLVTLTHPEISASLSLENLVLQPADESLLIQHARLLVNMSERHQKTMERLDESLGSLLPENVDAVIHQLEGCGDCQSCMDVCPICSVDHPHRDADGHYAHQEVLRWLVSCAGCGMCEQACPNTLPVSSIFAHIRRQLDQEYEYLPGHSLDEPLPLV